MKDLVNYHLYGEKSRFISIDFVHAESFHSLIERFDGHIKPHLHSELFHILCIKSGTVGIMLSKKEVEIEGPRIVIIPSNTVHSFRYKETNGWALTVAAALVEELLMNFPVFLLELNKVHFIAGDKHGQALQRMLSCADHIAGELTYALPGRELILQANLTILLAESLRALQISHDKFTLADNRKIKYYHNFQRLIKQGTPSNRNINWYASELNITPVHLNRICQTVSGKSALHVVHDYLIKEAIKHLDHTDLSVAEISFLLQIDDPFYFSKLFKKYIGISPKAYRDSPFKSKFNW